MRSLYIYISFFIDYYQFFFKSHCIPPAGAIGVWAKLLKKLEQFDGKRLMTLLILSI